MWAPCTCEVRGHPQMLLLTFPNCLGQDLLFAGSGSYARLASFQGFSCLHQSCCRHAGITDACYLADCGCGGRGGTQVLILAQQQVLNPLGYLPPRFHCLKEGPCCCEEVPRPKKATWGGKGLSDFLMTVHCRRQSGQLIHPSGSRLETESGS